MKKYCTRCGHEFEAVGREVICPACKAQAAEETKRAAVLKAKKASWSGESVPVRISGRASAVIRKYAAANGMPFAQALDELLKSTSFFISIGKAWEDITPYKSHRRSKSTTEDEQEVKTASKPQDEQDGTQDVKQAAQAAKTSVKQAAGKTASKAASKTATGKKAGKA